MKIMKGLPYLSGHSVPRLTLSPDLRCSRRSGFESDCKRCKRSSVGRKIDFSLSSLRRAGILYVSGLSSVSH